MLLDAGKTQVTLLDTSGKAANATATIAFSGTPVAAVALPQKINGGRDLVVLTSSAVEPIVTEDAPIRRTTSTRPRISIRLALVPRTRP